MDNSKELSGSPLFQELVNKIQKLEQRVSLLESNKHNLAYENEDEPDDLHFGFKLKSASDLHLESSIGRYGLTWIGNIVLFLGIAFLVKYLNVSGFSIIAPLSGYITIVGIFWVAHILRESNPYMSKIFKLNGYLLVYFITLKLHFFTSTPLISSEALGLILLLGVSCTYLVLSITRKDSVLAGITLVLIAVTAVLSNSTHAMFSIATLLAITSIIFLYRFGWIRVLYLSIIIVYLIDMLWLFNNPVAGNKFQLIADPQFGYLYTYLIAAIFSLISLAPIKEGFYKSNSIISSILLNGIGFSIVIAILILSFYKDNYALPTGLIALYSLAFSIVLMFRTNWKLSASLYALYGFVTLSITIYGMFGFPGSFLLLALQSLLVVSLAIWFRSRFIVIMNSLLFVVLLLLYLSSSTPDNFINISFTLVALATARILNWKKERLTIRTNFIRNLYLILAFFMVLYTLYHLMPGQYVTLSWTVSAAFFYLLSRLLKNVKYRYMGLGIMIVSGIYLFIVDLAQIELVFRIIAFMFLAIISLGISIYYSRLSKKKTAE